MKARHSNSNGRKESQKNEREEGNEKLESMMRLCRINRESEWREAKCERRRKRLKGNRMGLTKEKVKKGVNCGKKFKQKMAEREIDRVRRRRSRREKKEEKAKENDTKT